MDFTSIDIDFDVHKLIEGERRSFAETPNTALRRLLKLPERAASPPTPDISKDGRPWYGQGVLIPHGTLARMEYDRGSQVYEGRFLDGALVVGGKRFTSLSTAAGSLATTKSGGTPSLNGWDYWSVKLPDSDEYVPMQHLRRRAKGKAVF